MAYYFEVGKPLTAKKNITEQLKVYIPVQVFDQLPVRTPKVRLQEHQGNHTLGTENTTGTFLVFFDLELFHQIIPWYSNMDLTDFTQ